MKLLWPLIKSGFLKPLLASHYKYIYFNCSTIVVVAIDRVHLVSQYNDLTDSRDVYSRLGNFPFSLSAPKDT
jgi:hypothetical protein